MKKNILIGSIIASCVLATSSLMAANINPNDVKLGSLKDLSKSNSLVQEIQNLDMVKQAQLKVVQVYPTNGLYFVTFEAPGGQVSNLFVSGDKQLLIHSGQGIDTQTGVPFKPPVNVAELQGLESFKVGTGPKVIHVFTDPECPYCVEFEKKWESLKDKYTMVVYLMPLSFHKEAPEMSHYIMAASTDAEKTQRLHEVSIKDTKYKGYMKVETVDVYKTVEKHLKDIEAAALKHMISGTPTILDEKGNSLNWQKL